MYPPPTPVPVGPPPLEQNALVLCYVLATLCILGGDDGGDVPSGGRGGSGGDGNDDKKKTREHIV